MRRYLGFFFFGIVTTALSAQQTTYRFDFGTGKPRTGFIKITSASVYDANTGFGFHKKGLTGGTATVNLQAQDACIRSSSPFYFSVQLPEGNYDVKVQLGSLNDTSATTVRVENRRLLLNHIRTKKGEIRTERFTVHVRDSFIRNPAGYAFDKVKLKSRESAYFHWDNLLTLEFNGALPAIDALEIIPNTTAATIFLAGNSTVVDQDREPWAAWGQIFPSFLIPGKVAVANYAESGETMKAFKGEKRLAKIWSLAKPGDYLFMEFTHNDQKPGSNHLDPFTTYKETLKEWITAARERKVIPVLVTSMHRRHFDSVGYIVNSLLEYPEAMRQTAQEEKVLLLDLNAMSKILYEAWGPEPSKKAFVHYPANTFPGQEKKLEDNTHFNPYGADALARCVVQAIREQRTPLAAFIRKEIPLYNPARPIPFELFYWPPSPSVTNIKPDGN